MKHTFFLKAQNPVKKIFSFQKHETKMSDKSPECSITNLTQNIQKVTYKLK